jgi:hypothetical protein
MSKKLNIDDSHDHLPLLERPYADRQLIMVVDDNLLREQKEAALKKQVEGVDSKWPERVRSGLKLSSSGSSENIYTKTQLALAKLNAKGVKIVKVAESKAIQLFKFPPGHPLPAVVYIAHPLILGQYFPMAQFHQALFQEKYNEIIDVLMALGATEIKVICKEGWTKTITSNIGGSATVPAMRVEVTETNKEKQKKQKFSLSEPYKMINRSVSASSSSSASNQVIYHAALKGSNEPRLPKELNWYSHEPDWQQLGDGRINHGLLECQLTINNQNNFGITTELVNSISSVGINLGGKVENYKFTEWQIQVKFLN